MRDSHGPVMLTLDPFRLDSVGNLREHWAQKARRTKHQRSTVYRWLQQGYGLRCPFSVPLTITLTRIAPRFLDATDNLPMACKAVMDGISDYLVGEYLKGHWQDNQPGLTWIIQQRKGEPKQYMLEIMFAPPGGTE